MDTSTFTNLEHPLGEQLFGYHTSAVVGNKVLAIVETRMASMPILVVDVDNHDLTSIPGYDDTANGQYDPQGVSFHTTAVVGNKVVAAPYRTGAVLAVDVNAT